MPSLDPSRQYKPLDFGNGIVSGTVGATGRLLSLGAAHPIHGRVVLSATPPFDEQRQADQPAVRRYRAALAAADRPGFGFELDGVPGGASLIGDRVPSITVRAGGRTVEIATFAPPGRRGAIQRARGGAGLGFGGDPRLARAAYTQLTPGGRLPPVGPSGLDAAFAVRRADRDGDAYLAVAIGRTADDAAAEAEAMLRDGPSAVDEVADDEATSSAARIARALAYCLDCAVCRLDDGTVAILADHEILPLVWTRDAYYVAHALALVRPADAAARTTVAAFVRWLFERAERIDGWWPRASLASGAAKDPQFQLDQQLYPLLLSIETAMHLTEAREVLERILSRRAVNGLIATSETPADDPIALPYHFSCCGTPFGGSTIRMRTGCAARSCAPSSGMAASRMRSALTAKRGITTTRTTFRRYSRQAGASAHRTIRCGARPSSSPGARRTPATSPGPSAGSGRSTRRTRGRSATSRRSSWRGSSATELVSGAPPSASDRWRRGTRRCPRPTTNRAGSSPRATGSPGRTRCERSSSAIRGG